MKHKSPWLEEVEGHIKFDEIKNSSDADVVIIGGGISGMSTAFYLLQNTNLSVTVVDAGRIAHGASGNNAGLGIAWLERSVADLINTYGEEVVLNTFRFLDTGWGNLLEVLEVTSSQSLASAIWGLGIIDDIDEAIRDSWQRWAIVKSDSKYKGKMFVLKDLKGKVKHTDVTHYVEFDELQNMDSMTNEKTVAVDFSKVGIINTAELIYDMVSYLHLRYPERLKIYENSRVESIWEFEDQLSTRFEPLNRGEEGYESLIELKSRYVVVASNGFEKVTVVGKNGDDFQDTFLHREIDSLASTMMGFDISYKSYSSHVTTAHEKSGGEWNNSFWYFSTRLRNGNGFLALGGPDTPNQDISEELEQKLIQKVSSKAESFYSDAIPTHIWGGRMGYTPTKLRLVDRLQENSNIIYNIGCNGIGIIPALASAKKIISIINNEETVPILYDRKYHMQ